LINRAGREHENCARQCRPGIGPQYWSTVPWQRTL